MDGKFVNKLCDIVIENETCVRLLNLDLVTRRACVNSVKYFLPHARYSMAYKLGRWDGTQSFFTVGGRTYLNLLDKILPVITDAGYDFEITDNRQTHSFEFDKIDENYLSHLVWPKGHRAEDQPIILRDYQVQVINDCIDNLQGLCSAPTSSGKCQPMSSMIKTPVGWITMGEIKIGDTVLTPDGSKSIVTSVYDPGVKDVYEITFEDGRKASSCLDHIWKIHNHNWNCKWKNLSLREIIENRKTNNRSFSIPLPSMINDNHIIDLPINSYLLGSLLGDGSFRNGVGFTSADQFMIDKVSSLLDNNYELRHHTRYDYGISYKSKETYANDRSQWMKTIDRDKNGHIIKKLSESPFHKYNSILSKLGLYRTYSHTKFIPDIYLNAGYSQRLDMIRGLLDTDGYVTKQGWISFTTTSEQLAENFSYLIRSIGGIAKLTRGTNRTYMYKDVKTLCKDCYNVSVYHPTPEILVTLPRKLEYILSRSVRRSPILNIIDIKKISTEPVRCIMIDHPDHLYITNDFIVTHNTIISASLSKIAEKYGRTIVIVPNKNLVLQTEQDYLNIGLDVGVLFGDRKEYHRTHTICTWQSLMVLDKKNKDALDDDQLEVFLNNLTMVLCDEVHTVKNMNVLHNLLTTTFSNIPIRWGLTGTIPEEEYDQMSLFSAIGPMIGSLTAKSLQDAGHLANCHVNVLQTQESVVYGSYQEELKFLVTDHKRLDWLATKIKEIALTGNTLILIDRIETGERLQALIPESTFISGKMKSTKRKELYEDINLADNDIMIATYGTTSTGISINRIFNLVLVESGKSFTRVIQSIGRGLRMADDKKSVDVYDVGSKCKFSNRHLLARTKYYKKVEYPFTRTKIEY